MSTDRIILGIDPGTNLLGYGLIHIQGRKVVLLDMGVLNLSKLDDHALKLREIFRFIDGLITQWKPDTVAAEAPFFGKNVQSMLKLGRAQGVALAAALNRDLPVMEYAPRTIKQSITGKGAASKDQVAVMLQRLLQIPDAQMPKHMDATDGLAAAVCHYFQTQRAVPDASALPKASMSTKKRSGSSWEQFVNSNPERIQNEGEKPAKPVRKPRPGSLG